MGKLSGRLASNRTRHGRAWFWSGHQIFLFLVLVSVFVLVRIFSIYGIVTPIVCEHIEQMALASEYSLLDGPMDMAFWVGLAGALLVLAYAAHGTITRTRIRIASVSLGLCNLTAAIGLMAYAGLYWANYYPDRPGSQFIYSNAEKFAEVSYFSGKAYSELRVPITETWMTPEYGWSRLKPTLYVHSSGARAEFKQVTFCPALPVAKPPFDVDVQKSDWVLYDASGRMMVYPKGAYYKVDPEFYEELQNAFKDPSPIPLREYIEDFEERYFENKYPLGARKTHLLSSEEFLRIVEENWLQSEQEAHVE